ACPDARIPDDQACLGQPLFLLRRPVGLAAGNESGSKNERYGATEQISHEGSPGELWFGTILSEAALSRLHGPDVTRVSHCSRCMRSTCRRIHSCRSRT